MGAGDIPAGRGYSRWAGDIPAGRGYSRSGWEYSRRPGIFPTGPRIKGVKGTFLVSGGNSIFPAGRGYPRVARGHYHGLARALKRAPDHPSKAKSRDIYANRVHTFHCSLSIYLLDRNAGRCFNFFRLRNLQTDRQAGRQTIKRDGVRPTHLITSSHPSSRPSRPCTRPSAPRCCCCCHHRRRRRCSCTWPRRSSSGSA